MGPDPLFLLPDSMWVFLHFLGFSKDFVPVFTWFSAKVVPRAEEPGRLQSMGSQGVRHN